MKLAKRRAFAVATLALVACGPLIGLEDLHDRPATSALTPDSSSDAPVTQTPDAEAGTDAGPQCTTHADCKISGSTKIALCAEGHCVPVKGEYCQSSLLPTRNVKGTPPLEKPNPLVVAAFSPPTGTYGSLLSYELALEELDIAGGLPVDGKRYDLALLLCTSDPKDSEAALKHVVNDLKLPAVIANFPNDSFVQYVSDITKNAGVFVLNPNVTPEPLKYLDTKRTVLNLLGPLEDVALSYRRLVDEMSKAQRIRKGLPEDAPLKIALVYTDAVGDTDMARVIRTGAYVPLSGGYDLNQAIAVNGTSPADAGAQNFRNTPVPALKPGENLPHYFDVANDFAADPPDIVIALTGQEIETLVPDVEAALINVAKQNDAGTVEAQKILPLWLLGPRNADRPVLLDYMRGDDNEVTAARLGRFRGIQYAGSADTAPREAWHGRMFLRYQPDGGAPPADYEATENFYDAIYWLAYGFYRGKSYKPGATDREAFSEGVRHLFDGDFPVAPGDNTAIAKARSLLTVNDATYIGALGRPDIDTQLQTWRASGTVYCYTTEGSGPSKVGKVQYDARRYLSDGGVQDSFTCVIPK